MFGQFGDECLKRQIGHRFQSLDYQRPMRLQQPPPMPAIGFAAALPVAR